MNFTQLAWLLLLLWFVLVLSVNAAVATILFAIVGPIVCACNWWAIRTIRNYKLSRAVDIFVEYSRHPRDRGVERRAQALRGQLARLGNTAAEVATVKFDDGKFVGEDWETEWPARRDATIRELRREYHGRVKDANPDYYDRYHHRQYEWKVGNGQV